ncbi:uncharacterized protein B4U79_03260, partial [Dinothrombium tinctorium]
IRYSYRMIQKELKSQGFSVSIGKISKIKNWIKKENVNRPNKRAKPNRQLHGRALSTLQLTNLKRMLLKENPPVENFFKSSVHYLNDDQIEKRHQRAWGLYKVLINDKWRNIITSDEKLFHLSNLNNQSKHYYGLNRDKRRSIPFYRNKSHPKAIMVWGGISAKGKTRKCFKVVFTEDAKRFYPNGDYIFQQDSAPSHVSKMTAICKRK